MNLSDMIICPLQLLCSCQSCRESCYIGVVLYGTSLRIRFSCEFSFLLSNFLLGGGGVRGLSYLLLVLC